MNYLSVVEIFDSIRDVLVLIRHSTSRIGFPLWPVLLCCLLGCGKSPDDLLKQAVEAEKSAAAAWRSENAKAAKKSHQLAKKAADSLNALAKKQPENESLRVSLTKANAAEVSARRHAERADEERQRREKLRGLKVRTYQKTRAAMLGAVLPRLAQAADRKSVV